MSRNLKVLGLGLVAALALAAVASPFASASNFTASKYPVTITGAQKGSHVFTAGGKVTCTTATFAGSASAASETVTITPTYSGCTALGFINSTVTGFGAGSCDYVFHTNGENDLVCASGKEVVIDAGPCTIKIPAQNGLKENTYHHETRGIFNILLATTHTTGIEYTMVKNNFLCPETAGTFTNGKYEGETEIEGKDSEGKQVSIDIG